MNEEGPCTVDVDKNKKVLSERFDKRLKKNMT